MKSVFEKIIERLEESDKVKLAGISGVISNYFYEMDVINIINQVSEEYRRDENWKTSREYIAERYFKPIMELSQKYDYPCENIALDFDWVFGLIKKVEIQVAEECGAGWIPCSVKMPPVETEVLIVAKRKYRGGDVRHITTTAMYEDGTVSEKDSCWSWEDIEGEWDEENDCYIIPEGWWENRHYNPDEVYNNAVDDEVIAWQPLPAPYQPKETEV